jgi:hypothetical protein
MRPLKTIRLDKRGLGVTEVFVFMVAAITFSLILIFGYKIIQDFLQQGEEVSLVQFRSDLISSFKKIESDYGAVRIKEFRLPGDYEQVCFVDLDHPVKEGDKNEISLSSQDPYAASVWLTAYSSDHSSTSSDSHSGWSAVDENVFLSPSKENTPAIKVGKLDLEDGFLCLPVVKGTFKLVLEGKGDRTKVSLPQVSAES